MRNFIRNLVGKFKATISSSKKKQKNLDLAANLEAGSNDATIENITANKESNNEISSKKQLRAKQVLYVIFGILAVIAGGFLLVKLRLPTQYTTNAPKVVHQQDSNNFQLELATNSVKGEKKWQSYLEDKIDDEEKARDKQLKILKDSIIEKDTEIQNTQESEFKEIKERLSFALKELGRLKSDNSSIKDEIAMLNGAEEDVVMPAELGMTSTYEMDDISGPESTWNYIPSTSYVSGKLLGGIAVSTSVTSSSAPIPVIIRLDNRGNLPKAFAVDIKQCRLLASCYGDISSERAIIRAEELVCEDRENALVTTTAVAGMIYGDDGMNGIRGNVVSMSEKHLKSAFTSGVLSGFGSTARGDGGLNITSLGALSTKKRSGRDMAEEGLMGGVSTAAEKLADYHIRLAENISPVILIPGGTRVDVMFTKGVHIGGNDVQHRLAKSRDKKK